jgi:hypothetical protein
MAISVLQHKSSGVTSTTSTTLGFTSPVTAGSLLVVCVATAFGTTINAPTDNQSNTYSLAINYDPGATGTPACCSIFYAIAQSSGTVTATITLGTAHSIRVAIYEVSGVDTLDQTGTNLQSSTVNATVSTSGATTNANEYVIAFFSQNNVASTSWTAGSGYSDGEIITTPSATDGFAEDAIVSSTGVQTATATATSADDVTGVIATFYAASGGGTVVKHFLGLLGVGA